MTTQIQKTIALGGLLLLLLLASTERVFGAELEFVNLTHPAFAASLPSAASIPVGHAEMCARMPAECQPHMKVVQTEALTDTRWQELLDVNSRLNTAIVPVTDKELYQVEEFWTYPNGYGDCEDFVLAKRHALIDLGWPPSTLLISVVRQQNGEGHAVLMARTDRGDLVLDNQDGLIKVWNETSYHFIKRQSQFHAGVWVNIADERPVVIASR